VCVVNMCACVVNMCVFGTHVCVLNMCVCGKHVSCVVNMCARGKHVCIQEYILRRLTHYLTHYPPSGRVYIDIALQYTLP